MKKKGKLSVVLEADSCTFITSFNSMWYKYATLFSSKKMHTCYQTN